VIVLAMKVVLAPLLVTGATLAGRRWGAVVGGVVTAVPIVAGPILAILTIDHGRAFGAAAARGALLGVVALSAFCAVFAWSAARGTAWPRALALGWLAYAVVAAVVSRFDVPPAWGLLAGLAALAAGYRLIGEPGLLAAPDRPPPPWDLPARAGLTAMLVLALTAASGALGPAVSGVLTPFPVATTVLAAFTLQQDGPVAARALLRGFVRALPGFALCFFVAAVAL
jgi:hypothetical protein